MWGWVAAVVLALVAWHQRSRRRHYELVQRVMERHLEEAERVKGATAKEGRVVHFAGRAKLLKKSQGGEA